MTIVCGTDFSEAAARACDAAAVIAGAWADELLLVHVIEVPLAEHAGAAALMDAERRRASDLLKGEAARLAPSSTRIGTELATGASDTALVEVASRHRVRLIVVGALGRRGGGLWRLGSTADRVAQASEVPVLVARGAAWTDFARERRPLRVLVAVDATATSDAAIRWTADLESSLACEVVYAHVFWPPDLKARLRGTTALAIGRGHPEVEGPLETELRARIGSLRGRKAIDLRMIGGLGRVADHLLQIAETERSDLVVVGTRQETGLARLWHGSVSHGVIDLAPVSVVSVSSPARGSEKHSQ